MLIKPFPEIENIHVVVIPFQGFSNLITANVYAVGNGPVTLIDTGPKFPGQLMFIKDRLKQAGLDINSVERIILTHGHIDHFGMASGICETVKQPVECFIHAEDKWRLSRGSIEKEFSSEEARDLMSMVGVPEKKIGKIKERFLSFDELYDPLERTSIMEDGDQFVGDDYQLKVIHTPGHSPGSCCLYESRQKILFSGDHIIKHITPNPFMEIRRSRLRDSNYQSLEACLNSLEKLNRYDVRFVFPGHGEYIDNLPGLISNYKEHHRQRTELVWNAVKKKPRPIYYLIDDVFPYVPESEIFLAISEILVRVEILIKKGRVRIADPGPPTLYQAL